MLLYRGLFIVMILVCRTAFSLILCFLIFLLRHQLIQKPTIELTGIKPTIEPTIPNMAGSKSYAGNVKYESSNVSRLCHHTQ